MASILVVDDEEKIRKILKRILETTPHSIDVACNGLEALEMVAEKNYELMIVDLNMPRINGEKLIQKIRRTNNQTAFIILTGHGDLETATRLLKEYQISEFLQKPLYSPVQMLFSVASALEKQRLRLELENRLRQAQKMEALGTLAGGIAHDFSTLIGTIIGYTDIISKEIPEDSIIKDDIDSIAKVANKAKTLVKQIRDYSQPQGFDKNPINIVSVARDSIGFIRTILPATIRIEEEYKYNDMVVNANRDQISQVLVNLCSNAGDFMKNGQQTLKIRIGKPDQDHESALIQDVRPGQYLKLSLSDNGQGIDPEIVDRIFDPYFTTKKFGKGSGLGLSIVHNIIMNHDGYIFVESELGAGTTFSIFLPLLI